MSNKATPTDPVEFTSCCGAYNEEAGCCSFDHEPVLFTMKEQKPQPHPEFRIRPDSGHIKYQVPDWVKENRNRDTESNLDYE